MALVPTTLQADIVAMCTDMKAGITDAQFAEKLEAAITKYIKTATVTVSTTGTATAQTGTGTIS